MDVRIDDSGSVLVSPGARAELAHIPGAFEVRFALPGAVLLRGKGPRLQLAGEVVDRMSVMEAINLIATSNWRGSMHIVSLDYHCVLELDQGVLKAARSSAEADHLGRVLLRAGMIDGETFRAVGAVVGDKRFGELAVERGALTAQQLYQGLQRQAEEIFFGAMLVADGSFAFFCEVGDDQASQTKVHLPVQGLLMEGVQKVDEMALFRERIPSSNLCPIAVAGASLPLKIEANSASLFRLATGEHSIEVLGQQLGLSEFAATKATYYLLQQKLVTLKAARVLDEARAREMVLQFSSILQDIFIAVATYGGLAQTRASLQAWTSESDYSPVLAGAIDQFGDISPEAVVRGLNAVDWSEPLERLHLALHELSAFVLFTATTTLPRDQELRLARDINARLKVIRVER